MSLSLRRRSFLILLAALLGLGLVQPGAAAHRRPSEKIPLPDGFRPEGITIRHRHTAFLGSLADGDIYRLNLRTGEGRVISQGPGTMSVGLKLDRRGRLFVAGGGAGDARVVDSRSGDVLASYTFGTPPATFINDVVLTRRVVWFTDSAQPRLFGLPLGRHGALPAQSDVIRLPLTGEWTQVAGNNANGIVRTPDRKALLVVNTAAAKLFRVDPATGFIPTHIVASVYGPDRHPRDIAVAVNGTIQAVGNTFKLAVGDAGELVSVMVPESAFHKGRNRVEVFLQR